MTNPVHLLAVAALLLVAFLVGAVVGTLARLITRRTSQKPVAEIAASVGVGYAAAPLVAAPVIAPLPAAPTPLAPEPELVPVPDFAATMIALANEAPPPAFIEAMKPRSEPPAIASMPAAEVVRDANPMQPAHVAGETTSGILVAAPVHDHPAVPVELAVTVTEQRSAEVIPFPTVTLEAPANRPPDIVVGGETVAIVDASDLATVAQVPDAVVEEPLVVEAGPGARRISSEDNFFFVGASGAQQPTPPTPVEPETGSDTIPVPAIAANAAVKVAVAATLSVPEVVATTVAATTEVPAAEPPVNAPQPAIENAAPAVAVETSAPAAVEPVPEAERIVVSADEPMDEDAAMRAIEGNWSPRRKPVKPAIAAPEGANQAVAASARAVTAARRTAEAVVAEVKLEAGRPAGYDGPRDGRKDDLTHIIGVLPVIETAFNKLGIYHFDQVGTLTDENIGWIEGHLGLPGRISRELWREQARELSAVLKPRRAAES